VKYLINNSAQTGWTSPSNLLDRTKGLPMEERLKLSGELTICNIEELFETLKEALGQHQQLCIDLGAVEKIDTAAAQMLISAKNEAKATSISLSFVVPPAIKLWLKGVGIQL
jgi:ABC-type transporter Mla MlaB component